MTTYAVADQVPEGCDYLTAGKEYEVISENGKMFLIRDDQGDILPFVFDIEYKSMGGNWRRVEMTDLSRDNSNCCGAKPIPETDICSKCGEHAEFQADVDVSFLTNFDEVWRAIQ